jgi:hypothetical protein
MQPMTKSGVITGIERLSTTDTFPPHRETRAAHRMRRKEEQEPQGSPMPAQAVSDKSPH